MASTQPINWAETALQPDFMASVGKLAERRFGVGALAEEAGTYVIEYLSQNDWEKCRQYQGKAQAKTFLYTLASHALEEFSRKRFGRPRPPVWLQELGELWVRLWRSLCLERQALPALIDRYTGRGFREPQAVQQAARVIKARIPTCGQSVRDTELADDIDRLSDAQLAEDSQCDSETPEFDNPFHAELLMMIRAICSESPANSDFRASAVERHDRMAERQKQRLETLRDALQLKDQEKILLRMIFLEGLSKSAASRALGWPAHQAGRAVNETLGRIQSAIQACGIELDELLQMA